MFSNHENITILQTFVSTEVQVTKYNLIVNQIHDAIT